MYHQLSYDKTARVEREAARQRGRKEGTAPLIITVAALLSRRLCLLSLGCDFTTRERWLWVVETIG